MLSIKRAVAHLKGQGADGLKVLDTIKSLQAAGLLPVYDNIPLSPRELTSLLIGATAPDPAKAAKHVSLYAMLEGENGTFGAELRSILEQPETSLVTSIRVNQSAPFVSIEDARGQASEFGDFQGCGIRQEAVIAGGLVAMLSTQLRHDTEAGWSQVSEEATAALNEEYRAAVEGQE